MYLNEDLLIDILHKTGADAVHPGYGFLSEVPSFAQKVEDAGAIWVGPHHTALVDLGDKITARRVALRAKVPPVPGLSEPVTDVRTLLDFAHTHGYPIMMKRTDGGGGHGITVVHDDEELRRFYMNHDALQGGDLKEYFIEKFVDKARHVETQSGRDSHGNFTVYSTRDCSLQRRNQKLVEEAPAPFLSEEIISTLEEYSRRLFTTVGYVGLGTCEFMVTPNGKVYFLEVNPRLQVEHTVSEEVSGLDLVREQLNIAAGGELTRAPELRGHSFELRITSEDPATNLTPGSGTLEKLQWPAGPGVRIDSNLSAGYEFPPNYDSAGSLLIAYGRDWQKVLGIMDRALTEYMVGGVKTTIPFYRQVLKHPAFRAGMFDTGFIPSAPELMIYADLAPESERLAKLIAEISAKGYNPFVQLGEYRSHTTPRLPRQDVVLPAIPSKVRKEPSPYPHGDRVALLDYVRDSGRVHFTDTTTRDSTQSSL